MTNNKNIYIKFGLYLLMFLLINIAAGTFFFRLDLTSNKLYSLSDASKEAVSSLTEPLTINVFFSKNLPSPYNNVERYLHDILNEYELYSKNNLSYRFFDVNAKEGDLSEEAEANRKMANSYGIYPVNVQKIEQDEAKIQKAYMGMVFIHGDLVEKLPAVISTENLEYTITTRIRKMNNKISALLGLKNNINIYLINSSSLKSIAPLIKLEGIEKVESDVREIVNKINNKFYGKLHLTAFDPSKNDVPADVSSEFDRMGIQWNEIKTPEGEKIAAGKGIIAIGIEYNGKSVQKNLMSKKLSLTNRGLVEDYYIIDKKEIEDFINENVDKVININDDIGYLTSNGTLSLNSQLPPQMQMLQQQNKSEISNFKSLISKEYSLKEVDLKKGEGIPDSITTLIIAGPKDTFSDRELFEIDQFLMKGGSLAFFPDSFREIKQQSSGMYGYRQPIYIPINSGIEKLLSHYGITIRKTYLLDESCYINRDQNNNEAPIYFAPFIKNENINHEFGFLKNLKQLVAIKVSPIDISKKEGVKYTKLLSSSEKAWEMKGKITLMPLMIRPPDNEKDKKQFAISYLAEGKFGSYFKGKEIPALPVPDKDDKKENDGEKSAEKKIVKNEFVKTHEILTEGKGKIFVVGSSEMLKDNLIDENGMSPNAMFILNTIDYLNDKEKIAEMRGKRQKFNPISDTKPITRTFVKVLNIAGLTIFFIVFGIVVWIRRNKRRKKIYSIFN